MKFWSTENLNKEKALLQKSQRDFQFDQASLKLHLLQTINQTKQMAYKPHSRVFRVTKFALAPAALVVFLSGTFAFASNAKPGDKLFAVNKLGEKVLLSLPLPEQQKLDLQTQFLSKRVEALQAVRVEPQLKFDQRKLLTVKESDETFNQTLKEISSRKSKSEKSGNTKSLKKLDQALTQLESLADLNEKKLIEWEEQTEDETSKTEIRKHLMQIREIKKRVHQERSPSAKKD